MTFTQKIESFFGGTWSKFVRRARFVIFIVFGAWFGFAFWKAMQIQPLTKPEEFVGDDHVSQEGWALVRDRLNSKNDNELVHVIWGIAGLDRSKVRQFDPNYAGEVLIDEDFDLASEHSQLFFLEMCDDLLDKEFVMDGSQ